MFLFFAGPTLRTSDGGLSYPKTFPRFFKLRSFGGVGAPEGLENVPDILTQNFPKNKCFYLFIMARQYQNFPQDQNFLQNVPKGSAKYSKSGQLTCDFLAVVEGESAPPRRPEVRCDELRLEERLVSCGEGLQGRSFCAFCGNIWSFAHRRGLRPGP